MCGRTMPPPASQYTQLRHHSPMSQQQTSAKGVSRIASLLMPVHIPHVSHVCCRWRAHSLAVAARERCRGRAQAACAAQRPPQKGLAPPWRPHPRLWHTTARQARDTTTRSVRVAAVRAALLGEHDAHHHVHRVARRRALLGLGRRCRDLGVPLGGRIRDRRGRRRADPLAPAVDVLAQSPKPLELGLRLGGGGEARLLALVEDRRELAPVRLELVILGPQVVALVLLAARLRGGARKLLELLLESSCGAVLQLQQLLRAALEQLRRPRLRLLVAPADRRLELEPERAHRAEGGSGVRPLALAKEQRRLPHGRRVAHGRCARCLRVGLALRHAVRPASSDARDRPHPAATLRSSAADVLWLLGLG
mmetsp:Transcript_49721/g.160574  ORF Transcript_49721/g.160574 Transcript_49721/m.160574 type:complete len:365 (-) Transcript_49721:404-1498(-)